MQRLHALDIATGLCAPRQPRHNHRVGARDGARFDVGPSGRIITFNPKMQSQRAGLALTNGVVLVAWAATRTKRRITAGSWASTPPRWRRWACSRSCRMAYGGGIWQGGRAPTLDAAGNAYFATGNGQWDGTRNFGDSLLKFSVSRNGTGARSTISRPATRPPEHRTMRPERIGLHAAARDEPAARRRQGRRALSARRRQSGRQGHRRHADRAEDSRQRRPRHGRAGVLELRRAPDRSSTTGREEDVLIAYRLSGGRLTSPAYAQGQVMSPGHPGGSLTMSANGSAAGTGIVWASMPTNQDAKHGLDGRDPARVSRRNPQRDLDERAERRARPRRDADQVRPAGGRQRQGLHADP